MHGTREALLDELRIERAGRQRALSPFERLTQRERCVLAALVDGLSAEEIAESQFVALTTVRSQIRAVLQKLGVALATGRRRPRQPRRLAADGRRARGGVTPPQAPASASLAAGRAVS